MPVTCNKCGKHVPIQVYRMLNGVCIPCFNKEVNGVYGSVPE